MPDFFGNAVVDGDPYLVSGPARTAFGQRVVMRGDEPAPVTDATLLPAAAVMTPAERAKLAGIEAGAEANNISDVNATDLTDGGATALHKHDHNAQDNLAVGDVHTQYHTDARAATWLATRSVVDLNDVSDAGSGAIITSAERTKLNGIEALAEVNNISDTNATDLTDGGLTTLHKHRVMQRYPFFRAHTGESGSKYLATAHYGTITLGSYQNPQLINAAGETSDLAVVLVELSGVALPDPVQTVSFELWKRTGSGDDATHTQLAKTSNMTAIRGTDVSEPMLERLRWKNKTTGADDVAPIALAATEAISVRIVIGNANLNYAVNAAVEVLST